MNRIKINCPSVRYKQVFVQKFEEGDRCTYTIRLSDSGDRRYLRNVDGIVTASADNGIPQRWVINTYGEETYT